MNNSSLTLFTCHDPIYLPEDKVADFGQALKDAKTGGSLSKVLIPPADKSYHVEIPQPKNEGDK